MYLFLISKNHSISKNKISLTRIPKYVLHESHAMGKDGKA